jgi:hypothetical protein
MIGFVQAGMLALTLAAPADPSAMMAQATNDSIAPAVAIAPAPKQNRWFFGGSIGATFGDYSVISVQPLVGYRLTPKFSVGVKGIYEHVKDKRYTVDYTSDNFGGSVFGRLRPVPNIYLQAEPAYMSYEYPTTTGSEREGVPFFFLGGGLIQRISPKVSAYVEVMFDVLQDNSSPYDDWEPFISVGVMAGF